MSTPLVSIITPTWNRDAAILDRCIRSVQAQTYPHWEHIICSDGQEESHVRELVNEKNDSRIHYAISLPAERSYGNAVRRYGVSLAGGEYCVFLDDDNIIFPNYLQKKIQVLMSNPDAAMVISELLHFGPLTQSLGIPPQVLSADRPFVQEIDTLQVMVRTPIIREIPWEDKGYLADGYTYQKIAATHPWVSLHEVLAAHL